MARAVRDRTARGGGATSRRNDAGARRRFAPHQLRHVHAVELLPEGIPLPLVQRQLGHSHLSTTGTYVQGIDSEEIISMIHARRAPMMPASAGLAL
ncbi:MAG: tyrosine-type recombinase/integrase [Solirubrobacteraceae bacterium]